MTNILIPSTLMTLSYNGKIFPKEEPLLENNYTLEVLRQTGANCQIFAYLLLRHYDFIVPNYRSSELWADTEFSKEIQENYEPLDILFFNKTSESYGAHLAVYIGNNKAIHLSKTNNMPVIWDIETFFEDARYTVLLGGKRFSNS